MTEPTTSLSPGCGAACAVHTAACADRDACAHDPGTHRNACFTAPRTHAGPARRARTEPAPGDSPEEVRAQVEQMRARMRAEKVRADAHGVWPHAQPGGLGGDQNATWVGRWVDSLPTPPFTTLTFGGPTGTGKTHAAMCVLNAALDRGMSAGVVRYTDWLARLQPDGADTPVWRVRAEATDPQVLLVDDLAAELTGPASDFARRSMTDLLSDRQAAGKVTIFTTNLTPAQVEKVMGDRFFSRLHQAGKGLRFAGADRRRDQPLGW